MNKNKMLVTLIAVAIPASLLFALSKFSFRMWERTMKGPFQGIPLPASTLARVDSQLKLPNGRLLQAMNAYTNANGDDWPLLVLKSPQGQNAWSYLLQPLVRYPQAGTNDTPYVRDLTLLKAKRSGNQTKIIFSCNWGAGGKERGIIYLESASLDFKHFSISW